MKHGLCLVLALLMGCASLTPERIEALATIAQVAAYVGASQYLAEHPEHRDSFWLVSNALRDLITSNSGVTNGTDGKEAAAAKLLSSLPVDALRSPVGDLYVTGEQGVPEASRLVIWDAGLGKAVAVNGNPKVLRGAYQGLRRASAPLPPSFSLAKTNRVGRVKGARVPE